MPPVKVKSSVLNSNNQLVEVVTSVLTRRIPEAEYQNLVQKNKSLREIVNLLQKNAEKLQELKS